MRSAAPATSILLVLVLGTAVAEEAETPQEFGAVSWVREFDEGVRQAKKSKRPILLLFQEVPG